jgi:hypothetical protein
LGFPHTLLRGYTLSLVPCEQPPYWAIITPIDNQAIIGLSTPRLSVKKL